MVERNFTALRAPGSPIKESRVPGMLPPGQAQVETLTRAYLSPNLEIKFAPTIPAEELMKAIRFLAGLS